MLSRNPRRRSDGFAWALFPVALQLRIEGDGKKCWWRGRARVRFWDAQSRRLAARWPAVLRWPRAARRDKPQMGLSIAAWIRCSEQTCSNRFSSSHSMVLVEVMEGAFGNNFDPVLETGANALQRE